MDLGFKCIFIFLFYKREIKRMSNILKAFIGIENVTKGNRINNINEGLEVYIKNIFANTISGTNE